MSLLRRMILSMALVGVLVPTVLAQKPVTSSDEARAAARELVEASATAAQFDQAVPLLVREMTQAFLSLAPERAGEIRETMSAVSARFINRKSELIDEVVRIYADLVTVEDLRAIAAFYKSGAGRRLVLAMPEITRRSTAAGQVWGQLIGQELAAEVRGELKKRGIDL